MWILMPQQQQLGAQLPARERGARQSKAPAEAVAGREAQDHEQAGEGAPGRPPAARLEDGPGDNTPTAPTPHNGWADLTEAQRASTGKDDDLPLPEGK